MDHDTATKMKLVTECCVNDNVVLSSIDKDDWIMLAEEDALRGTVLYADKLNGHVVCLSTRTCNDEDRWIEMPSLSQFPNLLILDLHKSRYLTTLDGSVGDLKDLQRMILTGCKSLRTLPQAIGNLKQLTEVGELRCLTPFQANTIPTRSITRSGACASVPTYFTLLILSFVCLRS